jgi:uncharacterized peroxidase-related enzyme
MTFLPGVPQRASLLDVFKSFPGTSRPLIEFHEALMRGSSPLSAAERELIAAYVSSLNGCRYCRGVHVATAELLGTPAGTVERLMENFDQAPVSDAMRPVLAFARKLTEDVAAIRRPDVEAILTAGWSEETVYYTAAVTALFNFMNRLVEGLGIELDPAYVPVAAKRLAERGYAPLLAMLPG